MLVGELLKKKREESGRDLKEIADTLKIRLDYLKAIEEGDLKKLPAEVYLKGYLIEYAKILEIDQQMIMETYHKEFPSRPDGKDQIQEISTAPRKRRPLGYLLIACSVIALIVVIALLWAPDNEKKTVAPVLSVGEVQKSAEEKTGEPVEPSLPPDSPSEEGAAAVTGSSDAPSPSLESFPYTLRIVAKDTTWLSLTTDNSSSEEILLNPGDSVTRNAHEGFALKIGNAGGVMLSLNGKDIPRLGENGQVVNVRLPEDSL